MCVKILKKKKKKKFFLRLGNFFFKLGKKSPKSHWERGRISAPEAEDTNKIPAISIELSILYFKGSEVEIFIF